MDATVFDKEFLPVERRLLHSVGDERGFLILRLMLAAVLLAQAWAAGPGGGASSLGGLALKALIAAYAAAALVVFRLRNLGKISDELHLAFFMLDVGASLAVLRFAGGSESDIFTALLLLILASTLLKKPLLIFSATLAACLAYAGWVIPRMGETSNIFFLRLCLFLLITLFGVHIADYAGWVERETAKRYEERLAWMQRLSMVGRAMAAVLHEAKTPLATVVLNAESAMSLAREGKDPGSELRVITEEADHAAAILQNFLDFVKPTQIEKKILLVHEPLLQAIGMAKIRLDERCVALEVKTLDDCRVLGSSRHLLQAFANILNNAADAMPTGGKLAVGMERLGGPARRPGVLAPGRGARRDNAPGAARAEHDLARGGLVEIRFQDTGAGMTPEELGRLFEPFSTSKAGEEGHGLGLGIVRWILQEHGGDIRIESDGPGTGTRATLVLPLEGES